MGTDRTANGQKVFQRKCPARAYCAKAIALTKRFSISAVGRITAIVVPARAINAR